MNRIKLIFALIAAFSVAGCSPSSDSSTPLDASDNTSIEDSTTADYITTPAEQYVTSIEFTIGVPAYMSDSLQLRIDWGGFETNASWIGDEIWSATVSYPTNTEHLLTVTFSDDNGAIELGSFVQLYGTGANASEAFQITADQFDTTLWDADQDGISNLDELIAGTDPLVLEDENLDVLDSVSLDYSVFIAESFSRRLTNERPHNFSLNVSEIPMDDCDSPNCTHDSRNIHTIKIDVDELGNASIADFHESGSLAFPKNITQQASRVVSDNTINWEGAWRDFSESRDRTITVNFTNTVTEIDEATRSYTGTTSRGDISGNIESFTTEYSLTGKTIENSTLCEPISGTIVTNYHYNRDLVYTRTIIKDEDDLLWEVSFEIFDEKLTSMSAESYLARFLNVLYWQHDTSGDSTYFPRFVSENEGKFHCDLSDL